MKKVFFFVVLFVANLGLKAQATWEIDTTFTPMHVKIDSILMNVSLTGMQTNLLLDKGIVLQDPLLHQGFLSDSTIMDKFKFKSLYYTMHSTQVTADTFPNYDSLELLMLDNTNEHSTAISLIGFDYDRIVPDAISEGLLSTDGQYLYDVPLAEHPFEKMRCFAGTAYKNWFDTMDITFELPSDLILSNYKTEISSIQVDFDDGMGYVSVSPDVPKNIHYSTLGFKSLKIKLNLLLGGQLFSGFKINVRSISSSMPQGLYVLPANWIQWNNFSAEEAYSGAYGTADVTIALGCGHTGINKPLIIVPGIDHPQLVELSGDEDENYSSFITSLELNAPDFYQTLEAEGYDLVYINYHNGADYIQKNAYLVESVIRAVNIEKQNNGSSEPTSILGVSMGGVVARYALGHMEANSETHEVEKFISLDAPHNGANIPLGAQAMLYQLYDMNVTYTLTILPVYQHKLRKLIPQLSLVEGMLGNPATRQLLIHHYYSSNLQSETSLRSTLVAELASFGWPDQVSPNGVQIENILISNGSGDGTSANQGFNALAKMLEIRANTGTILPYIDKTAIVLLGIGFNVEADIWAMPQFSSSNNRIYHGKYFGKGSILGIANAVIWSNQNFKVREVHDIDNAPGGFYNITGSSAGGSLNIPGVSYLNPAFCHIPTISSSALLSPHNSNLYNNVNSFWSTSTNTWSSSQSPAKRYVSGWGTLGFSNPENQWHASWNSVNEQYVLTHFVATDIYPHVFPINGSNFVDLDNDDYNFGKNSTETTSTRVSNTEISNGGRLLINSDNPIGLASSTSLSNPTSSSDFKVYTNGRFCNGPVVIDVFNTSSIVIGDNSNGNTGSLVIREGDFIHLRSGSTLIVENNSNLIVEPGGTLIFDNGANIFLEGEEAQLLIEGNLEIGDGATFTFTKGSASDQGYIKFDHGTIIANGTTAAFDLSNTNRNNRLMVIVGELEIPSIENPTSIGNYIDEVSIQTGKIEYCGNGSTLISGNDITISNVLFLRNCTFTTFVNGLELYGQTDIDISGSEFVGFTKGILNNNPGNSNVLAVNDCKFTYCDYAIHNINSTVNIVDSDFDYCEQAVLLESLDNDAKFSNLWVNECTSGIKNNSVSGYQYIFIENSRFIANDIGCDFDDISLNVKCTRYINNDIGIKMIEGVLNLNSGNTLTGNLYSDVGGYCTFASNTTAGVNLNNYTFLYLENGYNNFIHTKAAPPFNYLTGTIAYSSITHYGPPLHPLYPLKASNNYWAPGPSPSLNTNNPDYYNISFPFPGSGGTTRNDFEGVMLGSLETSCYDPGVYGGIVVNLEENQTDNKYLLKVYPIPAYDKLWIEVNESQLIQNVVIYNIQGAIVGEVNIETNGYSHTLDILGLESGNYIVRVKTDQTVYNRLITIAH